MRAGGNRNRCGSATSVPDAPTTPGHQAFPEGIAGVYGRVTPIPLGSGAQTVTFLTFYLNKGSE
ncbi:hypothetical protein Psi01_06720 [Planobispora siamensis]|uniref:Uncharacterized protein n=1 Tax=Planobispora siamensis TaxID=936338 RepID=A0A8J3SC31_9ACTN|nr:hypothetical protein Psi01_06720 [Planobispora siamensis]